MAVHILDQRRIWLITASHTHSGDGEGMTITAAVTLPLTCLHIFLRRHRILKNWNINSGEGINWLMLADLKKKKKGFFNWKSIFFKKTFQHEFHFKMESKKGLDQTNTHTLSKSTKGKNAVCTIIHWIDFDFFYKLSSYQNGER